jgi:hypothetical protein
MQFMYRTEMRAGTQKIPVYGLHLPSLFSLNRLDFDLLMSVFLTACKEDFPLHYLLKAARLIPAANTGQEPRDHYMIPAVCGMTMENPEK